MAQSLSRSAFRPRPGRYAPPFGELAKRYRKDRVTFGHCIWSSMFEKAALSFSAFLISLQLT